MDRTRAEDKSPCGMSSAIAPHLIFSSVFVVWCFPVCTLIAYCLQEQEEGVRFPGTGVAVSHETSCGDLELNQGLLEEQSMLLTIEPSLLLFNLAFKARSLHKGDTH